jgi:hypothetical protein
MNVGGVLLIFFVMIAALMGLVLIGSHTPTGVTDTYGQTIGNESNASQAIVVNTSATEQQVGGGVLILVAGLAVFVVLGALVFAATRKKNGGFGRGS